LVAEALLEGFVDSITTFWWAYLAFAGLFVLAVVAKAVEPKRRRRDQRGRPTRR
jgi:hypothetical protein